MFERFSPESRCAIYFAHHAALSAGAEAIDSDHLLLGLLRDPGARVNRILHLSERLREETAKAKQFSTLSDSKDVPLTKDGKRVVAYAVQESDQFCDDWVDTNDLLLGILREKKCNAAKMLNRAGLDLVTMRCLVRENNASQAGFGPVPESWQPDRRFPNPWPRALRKAFIFGLAAGALLVVYLLSRG
jgi:ATP-dependent Clp protease ATP-binding subunit ClpC